MKILVINAGSSSLKYQLIDMQTKKCFAKAFASASLLQAANLRKKRLTAENSTSNKT